MVPRRGVGKYQQMTEERVGEPVFIFSENPAYSPKIPDNIGNKGQVLIARINAVGKFNVFKYLRGGKYGEYRWPHSYFPAFET